MTTSKLSRSAVPGLRSVYVATAAVAACLSIAAVPAQAEIIVRGIEGKPLQEARPAPAFLKPDVNIIVAQPAPSDVNPSFLGPVLLPFWNQPKESVSDFAAARNPRVIE